MNELQNRGLNQHRRSTMYKHIDLQYNSEIPNFLKLITSNRNHSFGTELTKHKKSTITTVYKIVSLITRCLLFVIGIWLLNICGKDFFIKLLVQLTVGFNANIINSESYYKYIEPNFTLKGCDKISSTNNQQFHRKSLSYDTKFCSRFRQETLKIPAIIHQTYKSKESIPSEWNITSSEWQSYHPDWQYMFWSDNDAESFMKKYYPDYNEILNGYNHKISKVDAWRYFILYHYGGVYVDMDIIPTQNIESILSDYDHVIIETPNIGLTNSIIASTKKSKLMKFVIDNLKEYDHAWYLWIVPQHLQILFTAGPTFFWSAVMRFMEENESVNRAKREKIGIMDNRYYNKLGDCDCMDKYNKDMAYFKHLKGNSWHLNNSWLISYYLHCHPILIIGACIVIVWFIYNMRKLVFHKSINCNQRLKC